MKKVGRDAIAQAQSVLEKDLPRGSSLGEALELFPPKGCSHWWDTLGQKEATHRK